MLRPHHHVCSSDRHAHASYHLRRRGRLETLAPPFITQHRSRTRITYSHRPSSHKIRVDLWPHRCCSSLVRHFCFVTASRVAAAANASSAVRRLVWLTRGLRRAFGLMLMCLTFRGLISHPLLDEGQPTTSIHLPCTELVRSHTNRSLACDANDPWSPSEAGSGNQDQYLPD